MKILFVISASLICSIAILYACGPSGSPPGPPGSEYDYYYDIKAEVVKVGVDIGPNGSKFNTPPPYHILLVKMKQGRELIEDGNGAKANITDTTMFMEHHVDAGQYYNTHVGDTLTLKYDYKKYWFKIYRKDNE